MIGSVEPRIILFDIGGVLIRLNDPVRNFGLSFGKSEFFRRWLLSPSVRAFERGDMVAEEFTSAVLEDLELSYGPAEFLERFLAWPGGPFPYAIDLVRRIDSRYPCGLMSNTNPLHWPAMGIDDAFDGRFDHLFLSYETGLVKPDQEAFQHVIDSLGIAPSEILFFDDSPLNVSAASSLDISAVLCGSETDLARSLAAAKVLTIVG